LDRDTRMLMGSGRSKTDRIENPATPRPSAAWCLTALLVVAVHIHLVRSLPRAINELYTSSPWSLLVYATFLPTVLIVLAAHARLIAPTLRWIFGTAVTGSMDERDMPGVLAMAWTTFFTTQCIVQFVWALLSWPLPPSLRLGSIELARYVGLQIVITPAVETAMLVAMLALTTRLLPHRAMLACFIVAVVAASLHALVHPLSAVAGFLVFFVCGRILTSRTNRATSESPRWGRAFVVHALNNAFAVLLTLTR